ncbi:MAG: endonuclease [Bacteroidales bacterium]
MKKTVLSQIVFISLLFANSTFSQIPPGYYDSAKGLIGIPLKQALHNIIDNHTPVTYADIWTDFQKTDVKPDGKVWDPYSDIPGGTAPYEFTFITNQCGSYSAESDCYNREHSFPESWFNGSAPMYTDLFHIYPTDGYVNNRRGNDGFGDVGTATWTSENGSKLGTCIDSGYTGVVFEPVDSFKGDFARTYFYMAVRYYTEDSGWTGSDMVAGAEPKPWALVVLKSWNKLDPVSQKEHARNDSIYKIQHNRNPFIDNPQWVDSVWTDASGIADAKGGGISPVIFPNPATDKVFIKFNQKLKQKIEIYLYSVDGQMLDEKLYSEYNVPICLKVAGFSKGVYYIRFVTANFSTVKKLILQ